MLWTVLLPCSAVVIFKPNDVILSQVTSRLDFNDFQCDSSWVSQAMYLAKRNICRLIFCQGKNLVNLNLDETTVGLSICYDLRFPGLFRANQMNPKVLVNIANWPSQRDHHWDALLMARAIENQAFAVGVNRSGIDGEGETYSGKSKVYSPQGSQIAEAFHEGLVSTYNIELSAVDSLREKFNTICDDRFHYVLS